MTKLIPLLLAALLSSCADAEATPAETAPSARPWTRAAEHPIVANRPAVDFFEGAVLGNGGLGAIVPERRHDIARLGLKAVIGGTLVNLMNAALAGLFFALQS